MAQVFPRGSNAIARASIIGVVAFVTGLLLVAMKVDRSALTTDQGVELPQPVPFSHDHHTAVLGIHCVYCHTSVEESAAAGIPPTQTCMNCHKQIWADQEMLEPVRASFRNNEPIQWNRVYDLPDFAYFNHSIHIKKGIGCESCHGPVNEMPLIYQEVSLQMQWCLDCHRDPAKFVRPRSEVFNLDYEAPANQPELAAQLMKEYHINPNDNCSTCHR